uniref:NADH-ubiquinone oxidoreductase chain 2 n=1 Tax=Orbilia oligospora TaxID=2813651 RepID=A0A6G7NYG4_ORBOL|nr:NADH dehydrogenase subunit 2 [Orbilia oligospora]
MILICSCFILLMNAVTSRQDKYLSYNRITSLILLYSIFLAFNSLDIICLGTGIGIFGGLFLITSIRQNFVVFILILSFFILQLISFHNRDFKYLKKPLIKQISDNIEKTERNAIIDLSGIIDFPTIILFILVGAVCLMSCCDLITMFLCLELQSYGLYILSSIYRNSELAIGAALTYFLLGGLSSCFILLGSALFYVNTGITFIEGIYALYSSTDVMLIQSQDWILSLFENQVKEKWIKTNEVNPIESFDISLIILSIGYLFKVSSAPFHFWSPDVYDSLPTLVTTFVAIMAKISIFIFMLDLVHFSSEAKTEFFWTSFLSLIIGTVVGLVQTRIKRLFAYSTISHVGFILLALTINTLESIQAFIFYLMQYSLSNLNFFFILLSMGYYLWYYHSYYLLKDQLNSPIPPLLGFFGKQMVLSAALDKGFYFMVLIAIITSVIGTSYYLAVIKLVFFNENNDIIKEHYSETINTWNWNYIKSELIKTKIIKKKFRLLSTSLSLMISCLTLIILLFIIKPDPWLSSVKILTIMLFNS